MLHLYRFVAPGTDLHHEPFAIQSAARDDADARAVARVRETFRLSDRVSVGVEHMATYESRAAYHKARDAARESGVSLTSTDADAVLDVLLGDDLRAAGAR